MKSSRAGEMFLSPPATCNVGNKQTFFRPGTRPTIGRYDMLLMINFTENFGDTGFHFISKSFIYFSNSVLNI